MNLPLRDIEYFYRIMIYKYDKNDIRIFNSALKLEADAGDGELCYIKDGNR